MGEGGWGAGLLAVATLLACAAAGPSSTHEREIRPLAIEALEDNEATRARFPYLSETLDEAAAFNREFPEAVPSQVAVSILGAEEIGAPHEIVLVHLRGTANCGTLGCRSWAVGMDEEGAPRTLLVAYTHPSAPPLISRCGDEVSLIVVTGHGMELAWTEWRYAAGGMEEVTLVPTGADPDAPPPCP